MAHDASLPPEPANSTNDATIQSGGPECSESSIKNADTSGINSGVDREKTLEFAEELMVQGNNALKENDYDEAAECYSRALEIRTEHFGELAPECIHAYYKYGSALLSKAQEDSDPVGSVPKKDTESQQDSDKIGFAKNILNPETSVASVSSSKAELEASSNQQGGKNDDPVEEDGGGEDEESDAGEADEDESDLDLAWKMLDIARAIAEKHCGESIEMVDTLSALAEVAMEREDFETSLSDYLKALNILDRLVESDSRHLAELNFRISLCLEIGSKAREAIPYCERAISILKARVQRLTDEVKNQSAPEAAEDGKQSSDISGTGDAASKQAEIKSLCGLFGDMEKKLEDLRHQVANPASALSNLLEAVVAKARGTEQSVPAGAGGDSSLAGIRIGNGDSTVGAASDGGFDSPTVSTGHTSEKPAVTHLGVVGRGVKRVVTTSAGTDSSPAKKPALDQNLNQGGGNAS